MSQERSSRMWPHALVAAAVTMCPAPAHAHLNSTGMGPMYDGAMHFVTSPEDLVPAVALALFAGLRGVGHGRHSLFALPAAWLLGGLIGSTLSAMKGDAYVSARCFLLLGGLLAANAKLPLLATTALAVLVGL